MADMYNREEATVQAPITADRCEISWEGAFAAAMQVQISYSQQIQRRITIARLLTSASYDIFSRPGWDACKPGQLSFKMGECGGGGGSTLTAKNCIVSQYSLSAEAEGLTVVDNIVIEFLTLDK
jgi:hypothetical protein